MSRMLVLGGTRSGKSQLAEQFARDSGLEVIYIATATARDDEMSQRIRQHQASRPTHWHLCEEPIQLSNVLVKQASEQRCLLVDCLTLWLTNCLLDDSFSFEKEKQALFEVLEDLPGCIIFVSNETNMGVTPMGALSREFCDQAGLLHQALAKQCDQVILTVAGLPHYLKGENV